MAQTFAYQLESQLFQHRLVPVIVLENSGDAHPLAEALVSAGLPIAEVTFRTDAAEESIRIMAERNDILVGAGTVLSIEQADRAKSAGAKFIVSPGFNPRVVEHCLKIGMPIYPGVSNPTDIEMAIEHGLKTVKFFPAEAMGGVKLLKAISAPYRMMNFIPTGGINAQNVVEYLKLTNVVACGGSWMVNADLYRDGDFSRVESETRTALKLAST